jgi:LysR family hydrogen peroxide-inducible transcriptional activator
MDLRQLAALVAVAEHGSFSAAADSLRTVQSNVSNHVARLEKELGVQLVDRQSGALTEEGQAVVDRARRINGELDALVADVNALRHEISGTVRLGMIGTIARWLAPSLLAGLAERHPKVHVIAYEGTTVTLEPQLANGRLDLAVVHLPFPSYDLASRRLFDEEVVLVVHPGHPLAARPPLEMSDLEGVPLLLPAPGTPVREEIDQAATKAGVVLTAKAELDGLRLIASLTFDGHGPSLLPATAVPDRLARDWERITVTGLPRRQVGVVARRRALPSAPARAALSVLDDIIVGAVGGHYGLHPPGDS